MCVCVYVGDEEKILCRQLRRIDSNNTKILQRVLVTEEKNVNYREGKTMVE